MDAELANKLEHHVALMAMVVTLFLLKLGMLTLKAWAREKLEKYYE